MTYEKQRVTELFFPQSYFFPSKNILSYNFGRILFQPGAKLLNKSTFSEKNLKLVTGENFAKSLGFWQGSRWENKPLGCNHGYMDRTWRGLCWFCLPVASSLCPHLCRLSWLGQAFPFCDKLLSLSPPWLQRSLWFGSQSVMSRISGIVIFFVSSKILYYFNRQV